MNLHFVIASADGARVLALAAFVAFLVVAAWVIYTAPRYQERRDLRRARQRNDLIK